MALLSTLLLKFHPQNADIHQLLKQNVFTQAEEILGWVTIFAYKHRIPWVKCPVINAGDVWD